MTRIALALLLVSACSTSDAKPDPVIADIEAKGSAILAKIDDLKAQAAPRNLVCERVKLLNDKATCTPEFSDAGEGHIHTARVSFEAQTDKGKVTVTKACGLSAGQLGMVCGELEVQPQQPAPQQAPEAKPVDAKALTPAKGAKK